MRVTLRSSDDGVTLRVHDDGGGFDQDAVAPGHLGIEIMRERAAAIDATLDIDSIAGQGTTVTVRWTATPSVVH